jgi:hypothetical protein
LLLASFTLINTIAGGALEYPTSCECSTIY